MNNLNFKSCLVISLCICLITKAGAQEPDMREMFYSNTTAIIIKNNYIKDKSDAKVQPVDVALPFKDFYFDVYGPLLQVSVFKMATLLDNGGFGHTGAFRDTLAKDAPYFDIRDLEFNIEKKSLINTEWAGIATAKTFIETYAVNGKTLNRGGYLLFNDSIANSDTISIHFRKGRGTPFLNIFFVKKDPLQSPPRIMWRTDRHTADISTDKFVQGVAQDYQKKGSLPFYEYWPGYADEGYDKAFEDTKKAFVFRPRRDIPNDSAFEYRLIVNDDKDVKWKKSDNIIYVYGLRAGRQYRLEVRYADKSQFVYWDRFYVPAYWYQAAWVKIAIVLLCLLIVSLLFLFFRHRKLKKLQQQQLNKIKAIYAQLNPHFVFNALGSIQGILNTGDIESANHYLSGFGKLLRNTLNSTEQNTVTLQQEMDNLSHYIRLEQLRKPFDYVVRIPDNVDTTAVEMLPLLFQPIIENAVKHGGKGEKPLLVEVNITGKGKDLEIVIKDNGNGFIVDDAIAGKGLQLTKARIDLFNQTAKKKKIAQQLLSDSNGTSCYLNFVNWLHED